MLASVCWLQFGISSVDGKMLSKCISGSGSLILISATGTLSHALRSLLIFMLSPMICFPNSSVMMQIRHSFHLRTPVFSDLSMYDSIKG